jgi:hypothetical protein
VAESEEGSEMNERKDGYYWVKSLGMWKVAFWDERGKDWTVTDCLLAFDDSAFTAINETRLTPPESTA